MAGDIKSLNSIEILLTEKEISSSLKAETFPFPSPGVLDFLPLPGETNPVLPLETAMTSLIHLPVRQC